MTKTQVREFFRTYQSHHQSLGTSPLFSKRASRSVALLLVFFAVMILLPTVLSLIASVASGDRVSNPLIPGLLFVTVGVVVLWLFRVHLQKRKEQVVRLNDFAERNGMTYEPVIEGGSPHDGLIFITGGHSKKTQDILRSSHTPQFEVGNYTYVIGHGKNSSTHTWGYIAVPLERHVPHMLLDSTKNNLRLFGKDIISSLPASFKRDQILQLEGDFNNHFTLYAPKEYERDALYVFTPDLMALLIDQTAGYDAEVVDDMLYIYSNMQLKLTDPKVMQRIMAIVATVGSKAVDRTDYYADTRVGNRAVDMVATQGQRLKRGISIFSILIVVFVVGYFLFVILDIWRAFQ